MRASIIIANLTAALACGAVFVSPACAQTPGIFSSANQAQDNSSQALTTDVLSGLAGLGLLMELFHSGSSSQSSPFTPASTNSGTFSSGGAIDGNSLPQRGGSPLNPSPVPEASTSASLGVMLLLGAGGLVAVSRRRRQSAAL